MNLVAADVSLRTLKYSAPTRVVGLHFCFPAHWNTGVIYIEKLGEQPIVSISSSPVIGVVSKTRN